MRATLFQSESCETTSFDLFTGEHFARGVNIQKERRCPHCHSIIYSRRHRVCGVCCKPLPAACTFTENESAQVASLLQEERQRHRQWLVKANFEH